jgi:hypothetical protein
MVVGSRSLHLTLGGSLPNGACHAGKMKISVKNLFPWKTSTLLQGLVYSLGPSLAIFFLVLPLQAHKGLFGLEWGSLTPLRVLFYNAVWGLTAGFWLQLVEDNR